MSQPTHGKPKPAGPKDGAGSASAESESPGVSDAPEPSSSAPVLRPRAAHARTSSPRTDPMRSDTMLIHGVSEDGESFAVLRARDDRLEAGIVRKVRDGEALHGELVRLTPRPESPLVCDVEVQYAPPSAASSTNDAAADTPHGAKLTAPKLKHGGPAQVATSSYRANWDAIWSKPAKANQPN